MRKMLFALCLTAATAQSAAEDETDFHRFELKYNKTYASSEERKWRKGIYLESRKELESLRAKLKHKIKALFGAADASAGSRVDESMFDDLTAEEIDARYLTPVELFSSSSPQRASRRQLSGEQVEPFFREVKRRGVGLVKSANLIRFIKKHLPGRMLATSPALKNIVDWRSHSLPPRYQGRCGACYAFTAIGLIETCFSVQTGQSVNLAVEEIVRCSLATKRCTKGSLLDVFEYIIENGITYEHYLPYTYGKKHKCDSDRTPEYLARFAPRVHATDDRVPFAAGKAAEPKAPGPAPKAPKTVAPLKAGRRPAEPAPDWLPVRHFVHLGPGAPPRPPTYRFLQATGPRARLLPPASPLRFSPKMADGGLFARVKSEARPKFRALIDYVFVRPGTLNLLNAVEYTPVGAVFRATRVFMKMKKGTVYRGEDCDPSMGPNHSFTIVGYNLVYDPPHYIVKNSWSDRWNEGGYGKVAIGNITHHDVGICCISSYKDHTMFPVFAKAKSKRRY